MKKAGLVINPHIEKHIDTGLVVDLIGMLLSINAVSYTHLTLPTKA